MSEAMSNGQDSDGIDIGAVLRVALAIVVTLVLAGAVAYAAWHAWLIPSERDAPNAGRTVGIVGPVIESAPQPERAAFMSEKERLLHDYAWVDPAAAIARIPIDDAMRILAERRGAKPDTTDRKDNRQ